MVRLSPVVTYSPARPLTSGSEAGQDQVSATTLAPVYRWSTGWLGTTRWWSNLNGHATACHTRPSAQTWTYEPFFVPCQLMRAHSSSSLIHIIPQTLGARFVGWGVSAEEPLGERAATRLTVGSGPCSGRAMCLGCGPSMSCSLGPGDGH
jgi:hypothetical protein